MKLVLQIILAMTLFNFVAAPMVNIAEYMLYRAIFFQQRGPDALKPVPGNYPKVNDCEVEASEVESV